MQAAGANPSDIAYINAHATSTPLGDLVEQKAIAAVFSDQATGKPRPEQLAVSSTKGSTGHLLGAAGAVEAIFTILAIRYAIAPPTVNLHNPDANADVLINIVSGDSQKLQQPCMAMTNSFGFGGTNASLVFSSAPIEQGAA